MSNIYGQSSPPPKKKKQGEQGVDKPNNSPTKSSADKTTN